MDLTETVGWFLGTGAVLLLLLAFVVGTRRENRENGLTSNGRVKK